MPAVEKTLGARLLRVAQSIPRCETLVDCGCDHGYVSIYAAKNNIAKRITASDINRGPLDNAEKTIASAGLCDRIKTVLTDGLDGISRHDCVVIAGMGGETIADIIERAPWTKDGSTLVLQPMTRSEVLREYLYREGFYIFDESFVREGRHMYCVILARFSGDITFEPYEKYISRNALGKELAKEYTDRVLSRLNYELEMKSDAGKVCEEEKKRYGEDILSLTEMRDKL